jgi:hypothetical protein
MLLSQRTVNRSGEGWAFRGDQAGRETNLVSFFSGGEVSVFQSTWGRSREDGTNSVQDFLRRLPRVARPVRPRGRHTDRGRSEATCAKKSAASDRNVIGTHATPRTRDLAALDGAERGHVRRRSGGNSQLRACGEEAEETASLVRALRSLVARTFGWRRESSELVRIQCRLPRLRRSECHDQPSGRSRLPVYLATVTSSSPFSPACLLVCIRRRRVLPP